LSVDVNLVNVPFTVTDKKGQLVPNLTAADFSLEEDGSKQQIVHFSKDTDAPLAIALLIDTSMSVKTVLDEEKKTALAFLRSAMKPSDRASVIGFAKNATLFQDYTRDLAALKTAIDDLEPESSTALYDAIYATAKYQPENEALRRVIILLSDGADSGASKVSIDKAIERVRENDAIIFSVYNAPPAGTLRRRGGGPGTMKVFSDQTGGPFIDADWMGFKKAFESIEKTLRSGYSLGYAPTNSAKDGKFRKIRIVPRSPDHKVKARSGYYAAKPAKQ
jgi:VWFA-related protein